MQAVPAGGGALPPTLPSAAPLRAAFKRASFPTPPARAARPRAPIGSALRSALILLARSAPRPAPAHRLAVPPPPHAQSGCGRARGHGAAAAAAAAAAGAPGAGEGRRGEGKGGAPNGSGQPLTAALTAAALCPAGLAPGEPRGRGGPCPAALPARPQRLPRTPPAAARRPQELPPQGAPGARGRGRGPGAASRSGARSWKLPGSVSRRNPQGLGCAPGANGCSGPQIAAVWHRKEYGPTRSVVRRLGTMLSLEPYPRPYFQVSDLLLYVFFVCIYIS